MSSVVLDGKTYEQSEQCGDPSAPAFAGGERYEVRLHPNDSTTERLASSGPVAVTGYAAPAASNFGPEQSLNTPR